MPPASFGPVGAVGALSVLDGAPVLAAGAAVLPPEAPLVEGAVPPESFGPVGAVGALSVLAAAPVPPAAAAPVLPEREPVVPAAGAGFFALSEPPTSLGPVVAVGSLSERTPPAGLAVRSYAFHSSREI